MIYVIFFSDPVTTDISTRDLPCSLFFFNESATTEIYTLSLHDALPIFLQKVVDRAIQVHGGLGLTDYVLLSHWFRHERGARIYDGPDEVHKTVVARMMLRPYGVDLDRKSTRLNSSHLVISYAVFCLKKK